MARQPERIVKGDAMKKNRRDKRSQARQRNQVHPLFTAEGLRSFDAAFSEGSKLGTVLLGFEPNSMCPWKVDDQRFFIANPKRSFRLRRIYPGEYGDLLDESMTHVLVRQLRPGLRDKRCFGCDRIGYSLDDLPDKEAFLVLLWEELSSGRIETPLSRLHELFDQAVAIEHGAVTFGGVQ